jgi:hypothetical protein
LQRAGKACLVSEIYKMSSKLRAKISKKTEIKNQKLEVWTENQNRILELKPRGNRQ